MRQTNERGFTIVEVMVAILVTAIALFGVTGAVLASIHAAADSDVKASLDDDALAVLSDVRMMTVYDPAMLAKLTGKSTTMTRTLSGGARETISVSVAGLPATVAAGTPITASGEIATATASSNGMSATERVTLYQQAPAPGSVVNEQ